MRRTLLILLFLALNVACGGLLARNEPSPAATALPVPTDSTTQLGEGAAVNGIEVDRSLPVPSVAFSLDQTADGNFALALELDNYLLAQSDGAQPVTQGQGNAYLLINDDRVVLLKGDTTEIAAEWLRQGENQLIVALNASDGSPWLLNGEEIGTQITFTPDIAAFPINSDNLAYAFRWANVAATLSNDLGYTITLGDGYLLSASLELIPCEEFSFGDWFAPAVAYAGHGIDAIGESRALLAQVERVGDTSDLAAGGASASLDSYCEAHYLIAAAYDSAENLPTAHDFVGNSLYLSGSYRSPNSTTEIAFVIETDLAWGGIVELPSIIEASNQPVTVTLTRDFARMFDGVDFDTMDAEQQAKAVLRSLVQQAHITLSD